ncbi:sigma-70 family RNA polymerase sigma factor [Desulfocurvibacter africanus]|uniref:RNA polymerase sigma factor n=1 Tax=Desulfocurvibacter africanus TaxID=873 RepID=UPI002FDB4BB7
MRPEMFRSSEPVMGNERQFVQETVFRSHWKRLRAYLRKRLSPEDAEDVLQTAFYRLVKMDDFLQPAEWISAWLFRVVKNESIDLARKKKEISFADYLSDEQHESFDDALGAMLQESRTPEDEQLRSLFWEEFEAALADLPEKQRFVFERTELKGQSFKELSEETGVAQSTLITRKRYAVLRLRERLEALRHDIRPS